MQVPLAKSGMYRRSIYSAIAINFLRLDVLIKNGFEISSKPFCLPGTLKNVYAESEGGEAPLVCGCKVSLNPALKLARHLPGRADF